MATTGASKTLLTASLLSLVLCACSPGEDDPPPIGENRMVELLIDFHLVEARLNEGHRLPAAMRDSIFAAHDVDSSLFVQAITFYTERPERYGAVYNRVIERMNTERSPLPDR